MTLYDRLIALVGVLPPFLLLWFAERFERRVQEPTRGWRYRVMFASAIASMPIAWVERVLSTMVPDAPSPSELLLDAYVLAAGVEEIGKVACLMLLTRGKLAPRTRYGALLYALHSTMGFAIIENVLAMLSDPDLSSLTTRFILRAYLTIPMHFVAGGVLGYFWARRRFDRGPIGLAGGACLAIAIHGTFNTSLLMIDYLPASESTTRVVFAVMAMFIPTAGLGLLRFLGGRLRSMDHAGGRNGAAHHRREPPDDAPPPAKARSRAPTETSMP